MCHPTEHPHPELRGGNWQCLQESGCSRLLGCVSWERERNQHGDEDKTGAVPEAAFQSEFQIHHSGEQGSDQAAGSVGHVVKPNIESHLVWVGVGENQVGVNGGVDGNDDAEDRQPAQHRWWWDKSRIVIRWRSRPIRRPGRCPTPAPRVPHFRPRHYPPPTRGDVR